MAVTAQAFIGFPTIVAARKLLQTIRATALVGALALPAVAPAEQVRVRHAEGLVHGFLVLRTLEGGTIADGDLLQTTSGARVTSRLVFHFKDGSLYDETAVFTERQQFRLLTDHLVQKGPSFPQPIDMAIDAPNGQVTVRYADDHGETKVETEHLDLPVDLANGLIQILLKNVDPAAVPKSVGFVAATPKPRLVKLAISSAGEESLTIGSTARKAMHYVLKVQIGGIAGLVAPLVGKQPPDSHVWILGGEAPAFVKAEQPMYSDGPVWRIELVSPAWPSESNK